MIYFYSYLGAVLSFALGWWTSYAFAAQRHAHELAKAQRQAFAAGERSGFAQGRTDSSCAPDECSSGND